MGGMLIQCQDVWKSYGSRPALHGLNLQLESGKIVGLLGPNGSGKTTLIKILNGLLTADNGMVLVDGSEPGVYTKSIISYLPDKPYFAGWMKVSDLFDLFEDFYMDFDREKADHMCRALQIDEKLRMKTLSKGTKEKVQLILVMSRRAKLYLLDEPIAGVDPAARDYILSTILNNYNPEGTVLISTHLISDVERVLDEVLFIQNGQIIRQDLFEDFYMDFDREKADHMCRALQIDEKLRMKTLSKGTKEKVQLILVMSRRAKLYLLDEPIAGVDPAARDYILSTILNNYNPEGTVLISTHLISDVERVLDEVLFIQNGQIIRQALVDDIREKEGKSVDELFRDMFRTVPFGGGEW